MEITVKVTANLKTKEAKDKVLQAARLGMRDTVVLIASDAVKDSPVSATYPSISKAQRPPTGTNKRSIRFEASGFETGEGIVDQNKIQGAVYSTSGYGGYLETGTVKMAARPYMKPALDRYLPAYPEKVKKHLEAD